MICWLRRVFLIPGREVALGSDPNGHALSGGDRGTFTWSATYDPNAATSAPGDVGLKWSVRYPYRVAWTRVALVALWVCLLALTAFSLCGCRFVLDDTASSGRKVEAGVGRAGPCNPCEKGD